MTGFFGSLRGFHPHVWAIMTYVFMNNVARAIWYYGGWSPFVFLLTDGSNSSIGWLAALNGLCELGAAAVSGWLADTKVDRFNVLRCALMFNVLGMSCLGVGTWTRQVRWLYVGQALYGLFLGTSLTSAEAIFADLISHGKRDAIYTAKFVLETAGPLIGSGVSLLLFRGQGNTWTLPELAVVMSVGFCLHITSMITLMIRIRGAVSTAHHQQQQQQRDEQTENPSSGEGERSELVASKQPSDEEAPPPVIGLPGRWRPLPLVPLQKVPHFVVANDCILVVGSGFITMYFGLFMIQDYGVSPMAMTSLTALSGITTTAMALGFGRMSKTFGRVQTLLIPKTLGPLLLLYIALAHNTSLLPVSLMFVAYAMRWGFMNCTAGITRALIMDVVPPRTRARWNAVESFQSASWSGTSVLGGYLTDHYGYSTAFFVTFVFHAIALLVMSPCAFTNDFVAHRVEALGTVNSASGRAADAASTSLEEDDDEGEEEMHL